MLVFLILACCVTIIICKLISANAHKKALLIERRLYSTEILGEEPEEYNKPKSPYKLLRDRGRTGVWGYCITENGQIMTSSEGYYSLNELNDAKELLWELESIGGYAKTKF